jgi:hypothetical protein
LVGKDAGVDRPRLLHLFPWCEVLVDAVDPHRARIVECYQNILGGNRADMNRAGRQPYWRTVGRQCASRRVDGECGDVMLGVP